MRFQTILTGLLAVTLSAPLFARAEEAVADEQQGTLIWRDDSCYFFVLRTQHGFGLYEFLGGPSPLVGNVFSGKLQGFGTRKITNITADKPTMVYSEIFTDSKAQMEKKIPRQCRKKKEFEALTLVD